MSVSNGDYYGSRYQQAHVCTVTAGDLFGALRIVYDWTKLYL